PYVDDGFRSTPTRSRTVLSYSTLFRRCATTRPGLIGPATPGGSTVDPPAPPAPPPPPPTLPVQPASAAAIAAAATARLHEGKLRSAATTGGIGRGPYSTSTGPARGWLCPRGAGRQKSFGTPPPPPPRRRRHLATLEVEAAA